MEIKRMRDLREDHDKTQQEIAELLNMHRSVYRRYESGERETPSWVIVKLAQYYRVSTDYLLGLKDEPCTRPLFCFCAAFALGCIASQYFLAPALWSSGGGHCAGARGARASPARPDAAARAAVCARHGVRLRLERRLHALHRRAERGAHRRGGGRGAGALLLRRGDGLRREGDGARSWAAACAGEPSTTAASTCLPLSRASMCGTRCFSTVRPIPRATAATSAILRPRAFICCSTAAGEPSYETGDAGALRDAPQRIAEKLGETHPGPSTASGRPAFCAPCSSATSAILTWRIRRT